jgi:UDPglucose 6-dehydrogenase
LLRSPIIIDLRNVYQPDEMAAAGFIYHSIGRSVAQPQAGSSRNLRAIA